MVSGAVIGMVLLKDTFVLGLAWSLVSQRYLQKWNG
jgi:hypothetical protein